MKNELMNLIFRNLWQRPARTIAMGSILALCALVLILGNAVLEGASRGIRASFIERHTGDVLIHGNLGSTMTLYGPPGLADASAPAPFLNESEKIRQLLNNYPAVKNYQAQLVARAGFSLDDTNYRGGLVFGVDPGEYRTMFPESGEIAEGTFLDDTANGIVLTVEQRRDMERIAGSHIDIGDLILLTSSQPGAAVSVREFVLKGVIELKSRNPQLLNAAYARADAVRELIGAFKELGGSDPIPESLEILDPETAFGGDLLLPGTTGLSSGGESADNAGDRKPAESALEIARETLASGPVAREPDPQAWHYILVKFDASEDGAVIRKDIEREAAAQGLEFEVEDWAVAAGSVATIADTLRLIFNLILAALGIVSVIVVMNGFVISVSERGKDIGTMRAIGASKGFVAVLLGGEALMLSLLFGGAGILVGIVLVSVAGMAGIEAPSLFFNVLFGGDRLYPSVSLSNLGVCAAVLAVSAIAAIYYPVRIALALNPRETLSGT